jgi:hypothetical protein
MGNSWDKKQLQGIIKAGATKREKIAEHQHLHQAWLKKLQIKILQEKRVLENVHGEE